MPDFRKISECNDPMEVLGAPMEPGLIPEPSGGLLGGWDVDYDEPLECESNRFAHELTRSELFDRYTAALELSYFDQRVDPIYLEDVDGALALQRGVGRILSKAYPGLQLHSAMRGYERENSYEAMTRRERSRFDKLRLFREAGYKLPRSPKELTEFGTKNNRGPGVRWQAPRHLARKVARMILSGDATTEAIEDGMKRPPELQRAIQRGEAGIRVPPKDEKLLEDSIKTIVGSPWPKAIFDGCAERAVFSKGAEVAPADRFPFRYRYVIFHRLARSAFKDAYQMAILKRVAIIGDRRSGSWMAAPKPF